MRTLWRVLAASVLTAAFIAGLVAVDRDLLNISNPSALLIGAAAFAAFFGGPYAGLASAATSIAFALIYFSDPGLFRLSPDYQTRILVLSLVAPVIALMIGIMRNDIQKSIEVEKERTTEMVALRAALDLVDQGAVLLDKDMRARFMNRAFLRQWNLPPDVVAGKPPFAALMQHGRDTGAYDMPDHQIDTYIAERIARVRAGDSVPLDVRLKGGLIVRFLCTVLPDGGRMLTYTPVTDLVRHADELRTLATVDGLTGLYNRRHFLTLARGEWERYQRYGRPLSLLFFDIDRFKAVNDAHGHAAGDAVLATIGRICREMQRASDTGGRLGGEEFAILLPETDLDGAVILAERLRQAVRRETFNTTSATLAMTISVGVADARRSMSGFDKLLKLADNALYEAKQSGRDRVVAARHQEAPDRVVAAE